MKLFLALLLALVIVAPVSAAKPTSDVWVVEEELHYGDRFTVEYTTDWKEPWGHARCLPNDTTIWRGELYGTAPDQYMWGQYFSLWEGGPTPQAFELTDPIALNWLGGGADCTLWLKRISYSPAKGFKEIILAEHEFEVLP